MSIDWNSVSIGLLFIETNHDEEKLAAIRRFLSPLGYKQKATIGWNVVFTATRREPLAPVSLIDPLL